MKYKVGDKVRVKSREWWDAQPKDETGGVNCGADYFTDIMVDMCGKVVEILDILDDTYLIKGSWMNWTDEMFEDSISYNAEKSTISEELIKDIADIVKKRNLGVSISENEGKLIIEPLKVEEEEDLKKGTHVMVTNDINNEAWTLRQYLSNGYCDSFRTDSYHLPPMKFRYIIEFDKFNPNNLEESLKYNIVK